jgi:tetratricopeptide (TPR) repeat protein
MRTLAALFTVFLLLGLVLADCRTTEAVDSETIPPTSRKLLRETGYQHFRAGQYQEAMACYVAALQNAEARGSNNRPAIASDLNDIVVLSEEMGQYRHARNLYARELGVLHPLGDAAGVAVGEVYLELGGLSLIEGSLSPAEADFKKAIALLKRHAGPDDPRTAKALAHGAEPRRALLWSRRSAVYCAAATLGPAIYGDSRVSMRGGVITAWVRGGARNQWSR